MARQESWALKLIIEFLNIIKADYSAFEKEKSRIYQTIGCFID